MLQVYQEISTKCCAEGQTLLMEDSSPLQAPEVLSGHSNHFDNILQSPVRTGSPPTSFIPGIAVKEAWVSFSTQSSMSEESFPQSMEMKALCVLIVLLLLTELR